MASTSSASATATATGRVPYTPPPSIGHELGVMFGFIGAFLISLTAFSIWWKMAAKRETRREEERIRSLRAAGYAVGDEKQPLKSGQSN